MSGIRTMLTHLLITGGAVTAVLVVLVNYGNALSTREDEESYLNKTDENMMASEQPVLIRKRKCLARVITVVAVTARIFLLASASLWVWVELYKS